MRGRRVRLISPAPLLEGASDVKRARPCFGQTSEAKFFKDGPTRGKGVDDQVTGARALCISCAGRDCCSIEAATTISIQRSSAVQPSERALRIGIQPADAHGGIAFHHDIAAMPCRTAPYGGE